MPVPRVRRTMLVAFAVVSLCAALTAFVKVPYGTANFLTGPVDFDVFRCAAVAVARRANPYLVEPLRSCEHASLARVGLGLTPGVVLPAPLPPYAFAAYLPFAALPYERASVLFALLNLGAAIVAIARLRALTALPLGVLAAAVLLGIWLPAALQGQPVPIVAAALCCAAWEARRGAVRRVPGALVLATLEPHLVAATLFALATRRAFRVPILGLVAALAGLSFAVCGAPEIFEYVREVLPDHAAAELGWLAGQQTIAATLFATGLSAWRVLAFANVLWLAAVAISVVLARSLARVTNDDAYLVLVPVTLALPWAPFLHATQYGLAVPGALLLAGGFARARVAIAFALVALASPWNDIGTLAAPHPGSAAHRVTQAPNEFASARWGAYIDAISANDGRSPAMLVWLKVPIWLAFAAITASAGLAIATNGSGDRLARFRNRSRSYPDAA